MLRSKVRDHGAIMPRFYFDITENGLSARDEDGVVVTDLDDAEREATLAVAEIAGDTATAYRHDLQVVISDEAHTPVARVSLTVSRDRLT
jgi:hypothetical protein